MARVNPGPAGSASATSRPFRTLHRRPQVARAGSRFGICRSLNALRRWCYPNQDNLVTAAIGSVAVPNGRKARDTVGGDSDFRIRSERWH
jgi:hypothetical protein